MPSSSVFIYETEDSEILYLVVHVEKPPALENEKYYFNSNIIVQNTIYSIENSTTNHDTTYAFTIDMTTGGLCFYGLPNIDIFPSPKKAWEKLSSIHKMKPGMPVFLGTHLIGVTIERNTLYIVCVKEKEEIGVIFNQPIYKIKKTNFYNISWDQKGVYSNHINHHLNPSNYKKPEFLEFDINENHFFCPTLDMSSPFPYQKNRINNNVFCWNKRFLKIFEEVGALQCCIIILQGTVFSMNDCRTCFSDNILFVLKRSSSNSGTRYLARGMNEEEQEPANECECEMIFIKDQNQYFSHAWRRGSPPIFWGTDATLFTTKNVVNKERNEMSSYGKTHFYFLQDIFVRFDVKKCHVISLLKNDGSEKDINDAYEESVTKLNLNFQQFHSRMNENENDDDDDDNGDDFFKIVFTRFNFDEIESDHVINHFIRQMIDEIQSIQFTQIDFNEGENFECKKHQNIICRFNCADSLDRTNVTSFALGVMLTSKYANDHAPSFRKSSSSSWTDPFNYLHSSVINFLCKIFTKSGDIASKMYANTSANRSYLIKNFFIPDKNDDDIEINNDVVNIVWRQINSVIFDKKRQEMIFEWLNSESFRRKRFVLDYQHIGFYQFVTNEFEKLQKSIRANPNNNNNNNNSNNDNNNNNSNNNNSNNNNSIDGSQSFHFIDESIFSSVEKCFVLSTQSLSANEVCVVFPEPVVVCSVSFLVVPQKSIQNVPSFDLFISDQISDRDTFISGSNTTFMHHINLPTFIDNNGNYEKRWVTYDLIYIAKKSSQFPLDPETLRFSRFAKIRFNMNSNKKDNEVYISNIKFAVKIPTNPKTLLFLKGHPPSVDMINQTYETEIDINSDSYISNLLEIERDRIEKGISDYHRNNTLISKGINPWIYDFPSQILVSKSENKCMICGSKFNDKQQPLYFVSHKFIPQFVIEFNDFIKKYNVPIPLDCDFSSSTESTQKIIEMLGLHFVKVCNNCVQKLIIYYDDQEKILTDTVFIKVNPTKEKVTRNFKVFPQILNDKIQNSNNEFYFVFNSNQCRVFNCPNGIISNASQINECFSNDSDIRIKNRKIVIGISFISFAQINKLKLSLNEIFKPNEYGQLKVSLLLKIPNQESHQNGNFKLIEKVASNDQEKLVFEFSDFPENLVKFFDLIIEDFSTKDEIQNMKKEEIEISLKRIEITGRFDLLNSHNSPYKDEHRNESLIQRPQVQIDLPSSILSLIRIPGWNEQTRTQKVLFDDEKNYNSIVFRPSEMKPDKKLPISLIIAYYDNDDIICYFESLIIPNWYKKYNSSDSIFDGNYTLSENDTNNQFIFPIREMANIKYILIFYLDRIENIAPYRVTLARI